MSLRCVDCLYDTVNWCIAMVSRGVVSPVLIVSALYVVFLIMSSTPGISSDTMPRLFHSEKEKETRAVPEDQSSMDDIESLSHSFGRGPPGTPNDTNTPPIPGSSGNSVNNRADNGPPAISYRYDGFVSFAEEQIIFVNGLPLSLQTHLQLVRVLKNGAAIDVRTPNGLLLRIGIGNTVEPER